MKVTRVILAFACISALFVSFGSALSWSNGGWSANPSDPDYGTHDWIAQHALDYMPQEEKQYITDHLSSYLFGTELPDLPSSQGGIGDTTKHHVYFSESGLLIDDASAERAQEMYTLALHALQALNYEEAAQAAGAMTHYIADLAVFGHVMGASTAWGTEVQHSDYETHVNSQTQSYSSSFNSYLSFDGNLITVAAFDATVNLAYDTTFDGASGLGCSWMDTHYDWGNSTFSSRCGQSLNLAVNAVADVLHSLYLEATPSASASPVTPEFPTAQTLLAAMIAILSVAIIYKKRTTNLS